MFKKIAAVILAGCVMCSAACAEEMLTGVICYPEGSIEETATYVYRYAYPVIPGEGSVAESINGNYTYMVYDAESFQVPITGESVAAYGITKAWTDVQAAVTCQTDEVLSVRVINTSDLGDGPSVIYTSQTYQLTGDRAGVISSLPYLLGILEKTDASDEWLEERQAAKAEACVQRMVWEAMEEQDDIPFFEELDFEWLCDVFYPEDDFYLESDGSFVFYIEPGTVAPAENGVLLYTFSLDDILDEL